MTASLLLHCLLLQASVGLSLASVRADLVVETQYGKIRGFETATPDNKKVAFYTKYFPFLEIFLTQGLGLVRSALRSAAHREAEVPPPPACGALGQCPGHDEPAQLLCPVA